MKKILYTIISYLAPIMPRRAPPKLQPGKTLTGYGRVNYWASKGKGTLRKDVVACAAAGVGCYTIEMGGWAETSAYRLVFGSDKRLEETIKLYGWLVDQCRVLGLWLHVSIVNDNMGSGKYGDARVSLENGWDDAVKLLQCVRENGPKNVLAQPVGETQTSAGSRFEALACAELRDFDTVNNHGSRPWGSAGMKYFAWHPFSIGDVAGAPREALIVSDTGKIIIEIGGSLDGAANPGQIKKYIGTCKARGCLGAIYYAFLRQDHDAAAIKTIGEAG